MLQELLVENYGPQARGLIVPEDRNGAIPLISMMSRSSRQRVSEAPRKDPIVNRRLRRRDLSIDTSAPLLSSSPASEAGTSTPRRPPSARTVASSTFRPTGSSPLDAFDPRTPVGPRLPYNPSTPTTPRSIYSPDTFAPSRSASSPQMMYRAGSMSPSPPPMPPVPTEDEAHERWLRRGRSMGMIYREYAAEQRQQEDLIRSARSPSMRGSQSPYRTE